MCVAVVWCCYTLPSVGSLVYVLYCIMLMSLLREGTVRVLLGGFTVTVYALKSLKGIKRLWIVQIVIPHQAEIFKKTFFMAIL